MVKKGKDMTIKGQFRQGDVLVEFIDGLKVPDSAKPVERDNGRVVLAHGEVTGHAHAYLGHGVTLFRDDGSSSGGYVELKEPDQLVHDEHSSTPIIQGIGRVVRQMQYSPKAILRVAD